MTELAPPFVSSSTRELPPSDDGWSVLAFMQSHLEIQFNTSCNVRFTDDDGDFSAPNVTEAKRRVHHQGTDWHQAVFQVRRPELPPSDQAAAVDEAGTAAVVVCRRETPTSPLIVTATISSSSDVLARNEKIMLDVALERRWPSSTTSGATSSSSVTGAWVRKTATLANSGEQRRRSRWLGPVVFGIIALPGQAVPAYINGNAAVRAAEINAQASRHSDRTELTKALIATPDALDKLPEFVHEAQQLEQLCRPVDGD